MLRLIVVLTILSLSYACNKNTQTKENHIPFFDLKELPEVTNLRISDLGDIDIEYIPLETSESCMISGIDDLLDRYRFSFGDSTYIIRRYSDILDFNENGRFITRIGTKGRGPNEFTAAHDVKINEIDEKIYLLARWQKKFFVYSVSGNLDRTFQISFSPSEFQFFGDKILCYSENHMGDIDNSYTLIDTNGIILEEFPNKYPFKTFDAYMVAAENLFYRFDKRLFKKEVYSDTIYEFKNENFIPHMVIQVGNKLLTTEVRTKFDYSYLAKNYIIPLNLFEFGDYVYYEFVYRFAPPDDVIFYSFIGSKKNGSSHLFNTGQGIINDFDGGPGFLPRGIINDSTLLGWMEPIKLKTYIASKEFRESEPLYPEKKRELESLANSLKETDNPVLVLVRLGSEFPF